VRLLAYFGESSQPCGNCDTCLAPPRTWDATDAARKALSAIYRTGQRFGAVHLIDVLRGKATERVTQWAHDRLGVFGIGVELDEAAWRSVFRQLVAHGMAEVDHARHGGLRLTDAARPVLRGEQRVALREAVAAPRASHRSRAVDPGMSDADPALLARLKSWRLEQARVQAVPAFVILHDRTLVEIARRRPRRLPELAAVDGIGAAKLERYGAALLQVVAHGDE
jgi:ATP-dependent DNA helicase RecQ